MFASSRYRELVLSVTLTLCLLLALPSFSLSSSSSAHVVKMEDANDQRFDLGS
jgi:hypothetical protein